jgi:Holliday junction resolvase RusA-like endonuclease
MMQIHFQVEGDPKGKGRPRFSRVGSFTKVYTDKQTLGYEAKIAHFAKQAMGTSEPLKTPVSVFLYVRLPIPQSYPKKRREACLNGSELPCKKPDIDNIAKTYLDAMNGVIFVDDTQVIDLHVKKLYSAVAGVDVMVMQTGAAND